MRVDREQRFGFGLGFLRIAAEMISIGPRIMSLHAVIALGILRDRKFRIDIAHELGLDPLEAGLEWGISRIAIRRIRAERLAQGSTPFGIKRVIAVETVLGINAEPIFLILQLPVEIEDALAANAGFRKEADGRGIGGRLLATSKSHELAFRGALAGHHDTHAGVARARGHCCGAEY